MTVKTYLDLMPFLMIFLHIIDDFVLQSHCLGQLKQKSWWDENVNDDIAGIIAHAFSWAFMIQIPVLILMFITNFNSIWLYYLMLIINFFFHGYIDDQKANKYKINLCVDQLLHLFQIICTYIIFLVVFTK